MPPASTYRSYAKINLFLEVFSRREDGYHPIETLYQTLSLCDELSFTPHTGPTTIECTTDGVPRGPGNLAFKAAELMRERCGRSSGVRIEIRKSIPVSAGLAGGSGNAAATLIALNELWELNFSDDELGALALELGSDVPYCMIGGTVGGTGRGEILEPLSPIPPTSFVLAHPPMSVSTAYVYNHPSLSPREPLPAGRRTADFEGAIAALESGDPAGAVFNRLEEVVFSEHPELEAYKRALIDAGCTAAGMSGSGPTLFGVCVDEKQARTLSGLSGLVPATVVHSVDSGVEKVD